MPGSPTTPGPPDARAVAPVGIAFHTHNSVSTRDIKPFSAHGLAYALPYRRFARTLAGAGARLGADAVRYSFIVADFHRLLLAGFAGALWGFSCQGGSTTFSFFLRFLGGRFFCSTRAAGFLPPRPQDAKADARSGLSRTALLQRRQRGLSLTDASTAACCKIGGSTDDPRGACLCAAENRATRL